VDQAVSEAIGVGDHLTKQSWSRKLQADDQVIELQWSPDTRGMAVVMPIALGMCLLLGWLGSRNRHQGR
jgi:hypothetical protein